MVNDAPDVKGVARKSMRLQPDWEVKFAKKQSDNSSCPFDNSIVSRFQFRPDTSIKSLDDVTFVILALSHEVCSFSGLVLQANEGQRSFDRVGTFNILCKRTDVTRFWDAIEEMTDNDYVLDDHSVEPTKLLQTWFGELGDQLVYNPTAVASEFEHSDRSCQLNEAMAIGSLFPVEVVAIH